jgi:hypothetical protein
MNSTAIAAALRILANAFEAPEGATPAEAPPAVPADKPKRGRGRPVAGEETAAPAPSAPVPASSTTTPTPAVAEVDPFAAPAPVAPTATLDEVRTALKALAAATDQAMALGVLKTAGGAANLTDLKPEKYGVVVAAATGALPAPKAVPAVEADPFEVPASAPATKPATIEDVKAAVVAAQKRTATDKVQAVVMEHGGKASNPDTGIVGPSLKALPESAFAATIAAINALPSTK